MPRPAILSEPAHLKEIFSSVQGEGVLVGRRQIFIRFSECNLDCRYCDEDNHSHPDCAIESTPGSGKFVAVPQDKAMESLGALVADWKVLLPSAHHSISITGGEPLLHADTLSRVVPQLRKMLPIHLETNGTMYLALERLFHLFDYISMDIKLPSTSGCTGDLWELHRNFLEVASCTAVSVKVVVSGDTPIAEIDRTALIIRGVRPNIPLIIQPLTGSDGRVAVTSVQLLRMQEAAASHVPDVRVIPQLHKMMGVR